MGPSLLLQLLSKMEEGIHKFALMQNLYFAICAIFYSKKKHIALELNIFHFHECLRVSCEDNEEFIDLMLSKIIATFMTKLQGANLLFSLQPELLKLFLFA